MIEAKMFRQNGLWCGFSFQGHAGAAEAGSDIVCAAVSAVAQFVIATLHETERLPAKTVLQEGDIQFLLQQPQQSVAQSVLQTLGVYLEQLASQYPVYLKIQVVEV